MTTLRNMRRSIGALLLMIFMMILIVVAGCTSANKGSNSGSENDQEFAEESTESLDDNGAANGGDAGGAMADAAEMGGDDLDPDLAKDELQDASTAEDEALLDEVAGTASSPPPPPPPPAEPRRSEPEIGGSSISMDASASEVRILDLRYVAKQDGGTVVIETSGPATYRTREESSLNQVIVEVANATLPDRLKRPYVTKDFQQSIASINAYQDKGSTTARIVIQFREPTHASVSQSGKLLTVAASGPASSGETSRVALANSGDSEFSDSSLDEMDASGAGSGAAGTSGSSDARILPTSSLEGSSSDGGRFYGRPISIEVGDTAIRDVINLIAEQSGANIVLASEVEGNISLKLKQIPWDQALLLVMKTKGLGYVRQGSVLRIAPLAVLQKESEEARKVLEAQKAAEPLKVKVIPVSYAKVADLEKQVAPFLSPNRGKAVADSRISALVITDIPENLERVANLVKALDTPPLQVLIEAKVVEASEKFGRNFGITWGYRGQEVPLGGNLSLSQNLNIRAPLQSEASPTARLGLRLGTLDFLGDLDAQLALFESEDQAKIISSPRILAMNNEAASIVQSTNIPIQKTTVVNNTPVTTAEYRPVELRLEVTPQITADSNVILQLNLKREFRGNAGATPDINTREAKTKISVRNGQTAVIGGVYQSDTSETEQGVPYLRNIPILGWLFKSRSKGTEKNELILFLTPRILNAEKSLPKEGTL